MKELNLHRIPSNKLSHLRNRAYIDNWTDDLEGQDVLVDLGWKSPILGKIIDCYTYSSYKDNELYGDSHVVRYYYDNYRLYLINQYERRVFSI